ncbi:MAG: translation initiation factor IF-2 N-terminal domain-containing protein, partial [Oscillospiraceae bacterium]
MSTLIKYRVHEVAKDFKKNSKDIAQILAEYATAPKNHMQVLEENELDLIFEYLTQHNQISDLAEVFAVPEKTEKIEKPAEKAAEKSDNTTAEKPAETVEGAKPAETAVKPHTPRAVPEKRVIDTRGATVNIAKYDDHLESLVPESAQNMKRGKEKFANKNKTRQVPSSKRRQEERDKMQKLQFEIAKKAPVRVFIPDEIAVGELALRMKKTGAEVVRQLVKLGTMASVSDVIDYETAALVALELGCKVEHEIIVTVVERLIDDREDAPEDLVP